MAFFVVMVSQPMAPRGACCMVAEERAGVFAAIRSKGAGWLPSLIVGPLKSADRARDMQRAMSTCIDEGGAAGPRLARVLAHVQSLLTRDEIAAGVQIRSSTGWSLLFIPPPFCSQVRYA